MMFDADDLEDMMRMKRKMKMEEEQRYVRRADENGRAEDDVEQMMLDDMMRMEEERMKWKRSREC